MTGNENKNAGRDKNFSFCLPVQVNPSPVYPGWQVQATIPSMSVQFAFS